MHVTPQAELKEHILEYISENEQQSLNGTSPKEPSPAEPTDLGFLQLAGHVWQPPPPGVEFEAAIAHYKLGEQKRIEVIQPELIIHLDPCHCALACFSGIHH